MIKKFVEQLKNRTKENKPILTITRFVVVIVMVLIGAFYAVISIVAIYIELTGGILGERQGNLYILWNIVKLVAGLVLPIILWHVLSPKSNRWWWIALIVGIGVAFLLLGINL